MSLRPQRLSSVLAASRLPSVLLSAAALASGVPAAAAPAQDPLIFVGSSVGGSLDPYYFVRPSNNTLVHQGGTTFSDNVTDAVFADGGVHLYVGSSLQFAVSRADLSGPAPAWSTLYPAPGSCYGLGLDAARKRLYTLTGASGTTFELHCIDADTSSAGYGTSLGTTTSLSGVNRERWELSPSGDLAAVPHVFLGSLDLVDTDPASATYLQVIASSPVPTSGGFAFSSDCAITPDDQHVLVLWVGFGEQAIACYHVPTGTWLDFDNGTPGIQSFPIFLSVPNSMDLSDDGSFLAISGQGGAGWAARIDLDYVNPSNTTLTEFQAGQGLLPDCNSASLSADSTRMSVTVLGGSPSCVVLDMASGAIVSTVALPGGSNLYTTAWQDLGAPPVVAYCTAGTTTNGCVPSIAGSGTPSASASSGFTISVASVEGAKQGLIFYGISGRTAAPWGTSSSFLCVKAPTQRTPVQSTGGTNGACDGALSIDWCSYVSSNPGALGTPFSAGDVVDAQSWFRDPPSPKTTMLSDALEFTVEP